MIRVFVLVGLVGGLIVAYLTTAGVGTISQLPPSESLLTNFREEGFVPANLNLQEDESAEDIGVFEVPAQDEVVLEQAIEEMGSMPGMDMSGGDSGTMDMATSTTEMTNSDGTTMNMGDAATTMTNSDGTTMNMGDAATAMNMSPSNAAMGDMSEGGIMVMEDGEFDREIVLTMTEWGFSDMSIDVKVGERIKFTVKNGGQIPHEFMFMNGPLMAAANYRATRADWSLFEHEALFEKPLVLPGGDFEFVVTVTEAGSWMFMCMLPYHMQMGMMGQMSTPGAAMQM